MMTMCWMGPQVTLWQGLALASQVGAPNTSARPASASPETTKAAIDAGSFDLTSNPSAGNRAVGVSPEVHYHRITVLPSGSRVVRTEEFLNSGRSGVNRHPSVMSIMSSG